MLGNETFAVALKNLRHQRLRSFLTLAGVVIGIAAIVALISTGAGLQTAVTSQFEQMGLNAIFVEPGSGDMMSTAISRTLSDSDVEIIRDIPGVDAVIPYYETATIAKYREEEVGVFIIGIDPEHNEYVRDTGIMLVTEGRELDPNDRFSVLVGERFAREAYSNELGIRSHIEMNGKMFRIAGLLDEAGSGIAGMSVGNMIFAHKDILKSVFDEENPTELQVMAATNEDVPRIIEDIEYELEKDHGTKDFFVMSTEQLLEGAGLVFGIINLVLVGIAAISLLVGGIGIMNTMFMAVLERTREVGVMKAIGATNRKIRNIFLIEAGLVGVAGGIIGSLIGFSFSAIISFAASTAGFDLPVQISIILFLQAIFFAMIVGMIAGYIPAKRASELDPVEALRYE